jgi:hypothetical protein
MEQLDFNIKDENKISIIKDPFQINYITNVSINYFNGGNYSKPYWYGRVTFKNGNTVGEQNTNHVESFEEIVVEIRQILNSLN